LDLKFLLGHDVDDGRNFFVAQAQMSADVSALIKNALASDDDSIVRSFGESDRGSQRQGDGHEQARVAVNHRFGLRTRRW
jgi:hypothetical protein